jgi:uncharacterized protein (TIGR03790 family)
MAAMTRTLLSACVLFAACAGPAAEGPGAPGGDAARVLVLRNADSPVSCAVADDYVARRGIAHQLAVRCPDAATDAGRETVAYAVVEAEIERPLRAYLANHPGIDFIVLTKGFPLRIADAPGLGLGDRRPSLDSWLAALGYAQVEGVVPVRLVDGGFTGNAWANRFWNSEERFSHARHGGWLVTRLDGYTQAEAIALTTRALAAEQAPPPAGGGVLLDCCPAFGFADPAAQPRAILRERDPASGRVLVAELDFRDWNADLVRAGELLRAQGHAAEVERGETFASGNGLLGYASWGSNDRRFDPAAYRALRFAPGALVETAVSTSARTFLPTTGGQSLIADLLAQGATGAKGYTDEPLLQAVASPSVLFDRYLNRGWTLAESYAAASRFVAWEDVVVGDPLCRPWKR